VLDGEEEYAAVRSITQEQGLTNSKFCLTLSSRYATLAGAFPPEDVDRAQV